MRKLWFIALCGMSVLQANAQNHFRESTQAPFAVTVGLGVSAFTAPHLNDYINSYAQPMPEQRLDEFVSVAEYFVMPEVKVAPDWSVAVEYSFLPNLHQIGERSDASQYDFEYKVHMPTAMLHRIVTGMGYHFKFGGGVGYYVATFDQTVHAYGVKERFHASGVGVKFAAVGDTQFDDTFYGSISVDLRWGFLGEFRNEAGIAHERRSETTARMQFFSIGLKFGVMIQF